MTVPYIDLQQINSRFEASILEEFEGVFDSGRYILGDRLSAFECDFASFCGTSQAIGTGSGLDALTLIFESYIQLGLLKQGDKVLVPAHTYVASIMAIIKSGLSPVFVEPNLDTFNLDFDDLENQYSKDVKAVLAVHMYGQLVDRDALLSFCKSHNLLLIEDAAQAHGAQYSDTIRAGNIGDAAGFSFYPTKNLGALGDGGMITTNNSDLAHVASQLRDYGRSSRSEFSRLGMNSRLDEMQACILSLKLKALNSDNQLRRDIAKRYLSEIVNPLIVLPFYSGGSDHVWHIFGLRTDRQTDLLSHLAAQGVEAMVHYPIPIHHQSVYKHWTDRDLLLTALISQTQVSLPISPVMTATQIDQVIYAVNSFRS